MEGTKKTNRMVKAYEELYGDESSSTNPIRPTKASRKGEKVLGGYNNLIY